MFKTNFKRNIAIAAAMCCVGLTAQAKDYFVGPEANAAAGTEIEYRGMKFTVGTTAFSGIWGALGVMEPDSRIFFSANTIGSFTINFANIELIGANAWCDAWSGQRSAAETTITGTLTINAPGVTVNGFCFSGNGCVRNDKATNQAPLDGFSFIYNRSTSTTLTRGNNTAILYLGDAWRPASEDASKQNPEAAGASNRYTNILIAHNSFEGADADNQPGCIQVAGSSAQTTIHDNRFTAGGTSISLFNTVGSFDITHNRFMNVGAGLRKAGTATGEFCVRLYYIAPSAQTHGNIAHNVFDGCVGQSTMYSLIRFYSGDSNETVFKPRNCSLDVNYNTFKNKQCYRTDGFNYVFYANNTHTTTADVDWRWNHYDNSELCFGWVKPAWATSAGRYFAASTGRFNYEGSHGTTVDFYGKQDGSGNVLFGRRTPTNGAGGLKGWTVGTESVTGIPMHTVVQSMDIDDATGDVYLVNECNVTNTSGKRVTAAFPGIDWSDAFLFMSRVAMGGKETHMYLSYGGHGSNMAITRHNGQVYVVTGGVGTKSSTKPTRICIFPWVDGKALDLRNDASVQYLNTSHGHTYPYPSVDNDNRLLVVRSRESAGDYFTVYDLDDALDNPGSVQPIKQVFAATGALKITGSSRAFLNTADKGFKTWSDQGFTISGDYIYTYEGDGKEGYGSNPVPTDSKPVLIVNVINWRTGEFVQRSAILKSAIINDMAQGVDTGEPESMKIHRDEKGRPFMVIGVITGAGGSYKTPRKYNAFAYQLKAENGQGDVLAIPAHTVTANSESMSLTSAGDAVARTFVCTNNQVVRDVTATVVGSDGNAFSVEKREGTPLGSTHSFDVTFHPDRYKSAYSAYLRISSPNVADKLIPLTGTYTGAIDSGIADAVADGSTPEGTPTYYDALGRRLDAPQRGINIVRYPDGTTHKILNK